MVPVCCPISAEPDAEKVSIPLVPGWIEVDAGETVTPGGRAVALTLTAPVNPLVPVTDTLMVWPTPLCGKITFVAERAIVNPGVPPPRPGGFAEEPPPPPPQLTNISKKRNRVPDKSGFCTMGRPKLRVEAGL